MAPSFQAFLDWKSLRADLEQHRANVRNRNSSADPDKALELYDHWRQLEDDAGRLRSDRNSNAKAMKVSSMCACIAARHISICCTMWSADHAGAGTLAPQRPTQKEGFALAYQHIFPPAAAIAGQAGRRQAC